MDSAKGPSEGQRRGLGPRRRRGASSRPSATRRPGYTDTFFTIPPSALRLTLKPLPALASETSATVPSEVNRSSPDLLLQGAAKFRSSKSLRSCAFLSRAWRPGETRKHIRPPGLILSVEEWRTIELLLSAGVSQQVLKILDGILHRIHENKRMNLLLERKSFIPVLLTRNCPRFIHSCDKCPLRMVPLGVMRTRGKALEWDVTAES